MLCECPSCGPHAPLAVIRPAACGLVCLGCLPSLLAFQPLREEAGVWDPCHLAAAQSVRVRHSWSTQPALSQFRWCTRCRAWGACPAQLWCRVGTACSPGGSRLEGGHPKWHLSAPSPANWYEVVKLASISASIPWIEFLQFSASLSLLSN